MQMLEMLYDEIQDAVDRKVPFIIPIGTLEYHARHASCGTDTLVVTGCLRELEKEKEKLINLNKNKIIERKKGEEHYLHPGVLFFRFLFFIAQYS